MRSFLGAPLVSVVLFALAACDGNSGNETTGPTIAPAVTGLVEVIHASQDAPAVNVLASGNRVISGLDYAEGAFQTVTVGDFTIQVEGILPDGTTATVIPATGDSAPVLSLAEGERITVIAAGDLTGIAPIVLEDDQPAVGADEVRLRVVHAASTAAAVEVWVSEPGLYLFNPGNGTLINAVFDFGHPLTVDPGALLEFDDVATPANVRVVHASPDAPAVDVIVNETLRAVMGSTYGAVTDYLALIPDTYNFKVVPEWGNRRLR